MPFLILFIIKEKCKVFASKIAIIIPGVKLLVWLKAKELDFYYLKLLLELKWFIMNLRK